MTPGVTGAEAQKSDLGGYVSQKSRKKGFQENSFP